MESDQPKPAGPAVTPSRWGLRLAVATALLFLALLIPRVMIVWGGGYDQLPYFYRPLREVPKAFISGTYDCAFAIGLGLLFAVPLLLLHRLRWRRAAAAVYAAFLGVGMLCFLAAMMNVSIVQTLGRPFNYQWFYYSDFLRSVDSQQAIRAGLTPRLVSALVSTCLAFVAIAYGLGLLAQRFWPRLSSWPGRALAACLIVGTIGFLAGGRYYLKSRAWPDHVVANPVYAFVESWVMYTQTPSLLALEADYDEPDLRPPAHVTPSTLPATTRPAIKHVVLYVLESTPWEYVGAYGSKYGVTPNLDRWAQHAAIFENIYSHAPATNKTLFSLLCSSYPWVSYQAETANKPDIALPSITSELKSRGYASGFFYSGDLRYQKAGEFINARGFDVAQDFRKRISSRQLFTDKKWPFLDGSDDLSTTNSLITWSDERRAAGTPTFAMLWTNMTHYPYFVSREKKPFGPERYLFNQYLNALHESDAAFGALMDHLEKNNLLDETLVIVLGDHGEAFGRHDQYSHASMIYEENCHIPLLIINPALFAGQRYKTVGGIVDIAPTITDVLGLPPAPAWQGRSLFAANRPKRTYFFAPWSDTLFGFREADFKFLFNATTGQCEFYDLSTDPQETRNLIKDHERNREACLKILAGWVQYQNRKFDPLITQ